MKLFHEVPAGVQVAKPVEQVQKAFAELKAEYERLQSGFECVMNIHMSHVEAILELRERLHKIESHRLWRFVKWLA